MSETDAKRDEIEKAFRDWYVGHAGSVPAGEYQWTVNPGVCTHRDSWRAGVEWQRGKDEEGKTVPWVQRMLDEATRRERERCAKKVADWFRNREGNELAAAIREERE